MTDNETKNPFKSFTLSFDELYSYALRIFGGVLIYLSINHTGGISIDNFAQLLEIKFDSWELIFSSIGKVIFISLILSTLSNYLLITLLNLFKDVLISILKYFKIRQGTKLHKLIFSIVEFLVPLNRLFKNKTTRKSDSTYIDQMNYLFSSLISKNFDLMHLKNISLSDMYESIRFFIQKIHPKKESKRDGYMDFEKNILVCTIILVWRFFSTNEFLPAFFLTFFALVILRSVKINQEKEMDSVLYKFQTYVLFKDELKAFKSKP